MATTTQPTTAETTKKLINYRKDGGVAVIEMFDPPANTYTYEMNRQLDEAILAARGVFRLSDYLDEVVQPLWSYWELDDCKPRSEEARKAYVQLRRYRAAIDGHAGDCRH